jgi:DNA polymerase
LKDAPDVTAETDLAALGEEASGCVRCPLALSRTQVVFGSGNPDADLMIVGEAPGRAEDEQGQPFLGSAGKALDALLGEIQIRREDVYVANVVMCRPISDRRPATDRRPRALEISACAPYLDAQIRLVRPRVIVTLGATPAKRLLGRQVTVASADWSSTPSLAHPLCRHTIRHLYR